MSLAKNKRRDASPDGDGKSAESSDEEDDGVQNIKDMRSPSYGGSTHQPAELFRKDLISAMKVADSEQLQPDNCLFITDSWRMEWEKGVQVPVNPAVIHEAVIRKVDSVQSANDFKIPKKLLHGAKDATYKQGMHELTGMPQLAEDVVRYDLDDMDVAWLTHLNDDRVEKGSIAIYEWTVEKLIEEFENISHEKMETMIKTQEGLGIEYDEDIICDICRSPDSEDTNEMVFCDGCDICVHQACYGIQSIPDGNWLCRACAIGVKPSCILCSNVSGAMKPTRSGTKWAHVSCALWIPEVSIGCVEKMEPITKISQIPSSRWSLLCYLCKERVGACIQCSVKTCKTAFHVTCAFKNNLEMKAAMEDDDSDIKLRAHCEKHSHKADGANDEFDCNIQGKDSTLSPRKLLTHEEKENLRAERLLEINETFYVCVDVTAIADQLQFPPDIVEAVYHYWKLKRKSQFNKPLLTAKQEEADILEKQQEDSLLARMKMFVQLRQDLERVRNLCYMVSRREKAKREYYKVKERMFRAMTKVIDSEKLDSTVRELGKVTRMYHIDSLYDHTVKPERQRHPGKDKSGDLGVVKCAGDIAHVDGLRASNDLRSVDNVVKPKPTKERSSQKATNFDGHSHLGSSKQDEMASPNSDAFLTSSRHSKTNIDVVTSFDSQIKDFGETISERASTGRHRRRIFSDDFIVPPLSLKSDILESVKTVVVPNIQTSDDKVDGKSSNTSGENKLSKSYGKTTKMEYGKRLDSSVDVNDSVTKDGSVSPVSHLLEDKNTGRDSVRENMVDKKDIKALNGESRRRIKSLFEMFNDVGMGFGETGGNDTSGKKVTSKSNGDRSAGGISDDKALVSISESNAVKFDSIDIHDGDVEKCRSEIKPKDDCGTAVGEGGGVNAGMSDKGNRDFVEASAERTNVDVKNETKIGVTTAGKDLPVVRRKRGRPRTRPLKVETEDVVAEIDVVTLNSGDVILKGTKDEIPSDVKRNTDDVGTAKSRLDGRSSRYGRCSIAADKIQESESQVSTPDIVDDSQTDCTDAKGKVVKKSSPNTKLRRESCDVSTASIESHTQTVVDHSIDAVKEQCHDNSLDRIRDSADSSRRIDKHEMKSYQQKSVGKCDGKATDAKSDINGSTSKKSGDHGDWSCRKETTDLRKRNFPAKKQDGVVCSSGNHDRDERSKLKYFPTHTRKHKGGPRSFTNSTDLSDSDFVKRSAVDKGNSGETRETLSVVKPGQHKRGSKDKSTSQWRSFRQASKSSCSFFRKHKRHIINGRSSKKQNTPLKLTFQKSDIVEYEPPKEELTVTDHRKKRRRNSVKNRIDQCGDSGNVYASIADPNDLKMKIVLSPRKSHDDSDSFLEKVKVAKRKDSKNAERRKNIFRHLSQRDVKKSSSFVEVDEDELRRTQSGNLKLLIKRKGSDVTTDCTHSVRLKFDAQSPDDDIAQSNSRQEASPSKTAGTGSNCRVVAKEQQGDVGDKKKLQRSSSSTESHLSSESPGKRLSSSDRTKHPVHAEVTSPLSQKQIKSKDTALCDQLPPELGEVLKNSELKVDRRVLERIETHFIDSPPVSKFYFNGYNRNQKTLDVLLSKNGNGLHCLKHRAMNSFKVSSKTDKTKLVSDVPTNKEAMNAASYRTRAQLKGYRIPKRSFSNEKPAVSEKCHKISEYLAKNEKPPKKRKLFDEDSLSSISSSSISSDIEGGYMSGDERENMTGVGDSKIGSVPSRKKSDSCVNKSIER